jgi:hypothetical protein
MYETIRATYLQKFFCDNKYSLNQQVNLKTKFLISCFMHD